MCEVQLHNINFSYKGSTPLFNNLNLSFEKGDFCFILGENGSGKSSLLNLILGVNSPSNGEILFDSKLIKNKEQLSKVIGYVPQNQSLDKEMLVTDLIDFQASFYLISDSKFREYKKYLFQFLDIENLLSKRIKTLSGGQKQLINIVLSLIHKPDLILLDEPFVGLDFDKSAKLVDLLKELNKTVICITHDLDIAEHFADKIVLLQKGEVIEQGNPKELIKNNPFVAQELELKSNIEFDFPQKVSCQKVRNKLTLTYPNKEELVRNVSLILEKNENSISSIRTFQNTLKSSLMGLYNLNSSPKISPNNGGGKGGGNGKGRRK